MSPAEYCASKAAPSGSSLSYAVRMLPQARREAVLAVHAFCREVREVVREVAEPAVARLKLGWWRAETAAAFDGRPQHPITQALVPAIGGFGLSREPFDALIEGVTLDLEQPVYPDFATLEQRCRKIAGNAWLLCAEICGFTDPATADYARELGVALRLTSFIQNVGADVRRGLLYLPQDELARFGVVAHDLLRQPVGPGLAALMAHQATRARSHYTAALAALPLAERRAQRVGIVMAALGKALLDEIERDGFRVIDRRVALSPALKAWIAWKAAWTR